MMLNPQRTEPPGKRQGGQPRIMRTPLGRLLLIDCRTVLRLLRPGRTRPIIGDASCAKPGDMAEAIGSGDVGEVVA